jgi:coenzyme F420-0:L-glutamate ligase/coenzyme F420-1:gamma-L-glutamate ligase
MADSTPILAAPQWSFVAGARRATLATIRPDGRPRLVPVCFVLAGGPAADRHPRLYTPLDEKPKRPPDPRDLARVRDLLARPDVSLLVDRWDEDWGRLGWVRLDGRAHLLEPGGDVSARTEHAAVVEQLRAKYPQYREHALESRPLIRIAVERATSWGRGAMTS